MQLYLIRHTKVATTPGVCYGQSDVGLADSFLTEAETVKKQIADIPFNKIYSSPLSRCKKLSEYLFKEEAQLDDRLMEMNFGDWELQNWDDLRNPTVDEWMNDFVNVPCPNGESFIGMYHRVKSFIDEIKHDSHKNTAIVTHGGVIRCIIAYLNNEDLKDAFKREINYGEVVNLKI